MILRTLAAVLILAGFALPIESAADSPAEPRPDIQNRIEQLEKQIRELKALREKQQQKDARSLEIVEPCVAAVGARDVCSCLGENLPQGIDFVTYVRIMSPLKEEVGERVLEMVKGARERCVK